MEEKEKWLSKLRERLNDHTEPLPEYGWERLERELRPVVSRSRQLYTWGAVAAVAILVLLPAGWWFLQSPTVDDIIRTEMFPVAVAPDKEPKTADPVVATNPVAIRTEEKVPSSTSGANTPQKPQPVAQASVISHPSLQQHSESTDKGNVVTKEKQEAGKVADTEQKTRDTKDNRGVRGPSGKNKYHLPVKNALAGATDTKKWSFGLRVGNSGMVNDGSMQDLSTEYIPDRLSLTTISGNSVSVADNQQLVVKGGVPYLIQTDIKDVKHRQPVTVGLTVRKDLGKGFSVESGLTYTFLSSEIILTDNKTYDQKLHYMGIPIRGNWDFFEKNNFTLYLSAGGTVEKCIYGKFGDDKNTEGPVQLSVMGAVGAQYSPVKRMAIYFEPGVSYYFDNGSNYATIRKENPFNLNLQAGIRLLY